MTLEEIQRHLAAGSTKSVCISRRLSEEYPGHVCSITILGDTQLKFELEMHGYDEIGLDVRIEYLNLSTLVRAAEEFLDASIERWSDLTQSETCPDLEGEVDLEAAALRLREELVSGTMRFPERGLSYRIPAGYWQDIAEGRLSPGARLA